MTSITHGPDGPRFDGMTVGEVISTLDAAAAFCEGNGSQLFDIAAAALRHLSEWQPIETAPRDGTEILTVGLDSKRVIATKWLSPGPFVRGVLASYHQPDGWYWASWSEPVGAITPTHWRPLPPGPMEATP